jgi:hypothetical protein
MREAVNKMNRSIQDYNRAVRKVNQDWKRAADDYNREVRRFNSSQRARQQAIRSALAQLSHRRASQSHSVIVLSTYSLGEAYLRLETLAGGLRSAEEQRLVIDLPQQETANSLNAMHALTGDAPVEVPPGVELGRTVVEEELRGISEDLDARWRGAVFSLNPGNPDASRHFCASSREIFTRMLDVTAPDGEVLAAIPSCPVTEGGKPTRRAKIHYLLQRKGYELDALEEFVERDVQNIVTLFQVFNDATHGRAGKLGLPELLAIKKRVEDGILFISGIAGMPA